VRGQHILTTCKGPAMYVVNVVNFWDFFDFFLHLIDIYAIWSLLHKDGVAVFRNLYGSRKHDNREHEREDGVENLILGVVVNYYSSNDDTD